mgnify:CR=1 FL=1
MTPKQVLIKAREHISDPSMWYQGNWSQTGIDGARKGYPCCVYGAIEWALPNDIGNPHLNSKAEKLALFVEKVAGIEADGLGGFNDDPNTTHQDVLDVFDKAIEVAE